MCYPDVRAVERQAIGNAATLNVPQSLARIFVTVLAVGFVTHSWRHRTLF